CAMFGGAMPYFRRGTGCLPSNRGRLPTQALTGRTFATAKNPGARNRLLFHNSTGMHYLPVVCMQHVVTCGKRAEVYNRVTHTILGQKHPAGNIHYLQLVARLRSIAE